MKTTLRILMLCLCCAQPFWAHAQNTHWSVNIYDYQYDMTAYLALTADGEAVTDYSDYEIAAFCGDECRGVATIQTAEGNSYCYLRIRSNQASGEDITFKVYVKDTGREVAVEGTTMTFSSNTVQGMPSSPVVLNFVPYMPGDVNGDGKINAIDVRLLINKRFNRTLPEGSIEAACDIDGNGRVNAVDVRLGINLRFNR